MNEEVVAKFGADTTVIDRAMRSLSERIKEFGHEAAKNVAGVFAAEKVIEGARKLLEMIEKIALKSKELGVSTDFIQGLFQNPDINGEKAIASLEKFFAKVGEAKTGNKEAQAVFSKWGIVLKDTEGGFKSNEEILGDLSEKFASIKDASLRAALGVATFGKSWKEIEPLLREGREGIENLNKSSAFKVSEGSIGALKELMDSLKTAGAGALGFLGNALAKPIQFIGAFSRLASGLFSGSSFKDAAAYAAEIFDGVQRVNDAGGLKLISEEQRQRIEKAAEALGKAVNDLSDYNEKNHDLTQLYKDREAVERRIKALQEAHASGVAGAPEDLQLRRETLIIKAKKESAEITKKINEEEEKIAKQKESQAKQEERLQHRISERQHALEKSQSHLSRDENDLSKWSLGDLADLARPSGFHSGLGGSFQTFSGPPLARAARFAQNELTAAHMSEAFGDTSGAARHRANYLDAVKNNPALKSGDQNPLQAAQEEVAENTRKLADAATGKGIKIMVEDD